MQWKRYRSKFTLVELLMVISTIGVRVGLLLPAVWSARKSARRMQSRNNLKQLGLALLNYESALKTFPLRYVSNVGGPSMNPATLDAEPGWATFEPRSVKRLAEQVQIAIESTKLYSLSDRLVVLLKFVEGAQSARLRSPSRRSKNISLHRSEALAFVPSKD